MQWEPQQQAALDKVGRWLKEKDKLVFRLFGVAGSGKSTLAKHLAAGVNGPVSFAAYTGKAALVMELFGCAGARTIHSTFYKTTVGSSGYIFTFNRDCNARRSKLIVLDEISMANETLARDIESLRVPILVLGDPAQLQPIDSESGYYTAESKGPPDVMLTQIHRQARDNPIIALATEVREKQVRPALGTYGSSRVLNARDISSADLLASDQLIVGTNRTRTRLNLAVRELLERYDRFPLKGDKLICLRNNRQKGLINGGFWAATADGSIGSHAILLKARSEDFPDLPIMDLRVLKEFFTGGEESITWEDLQGSDAMTYGNAITTHKAQGSQMQRPIVFDESAFFGRDWWRHLYTGITRAIDKVTLVYGKY